MKTRIIFILLCFLSLNVMGQGIITRESTRRAKPKTTQSTKTKAKTNPTPTLEAAGYDVTFSCNVSSATLYIDGNANGNASGSHFLKTGNHTIKATAEGYKDYEGSISVNRQNTTCKITLEKKPNSYQNGILNVGDVSYKMVYVEGGTFQMGATPEQKDPTYNEKPVHSVTLSSYYIGETEVTQELWEAVMGSNPSSFKGSSNPVEKVSWDDCQKFISKLNSITGQRFRLPTEAEWEFAARGGNKSRGYQYSGSNNLLDVAWYGDNSDYKTHPVKTKQPNELGIYDMSGNVEEWCQDWYDNYSSNSQINPIGPVSESYRVSRGGECYDYASDCRVSNRGYKKPDSRFLNLGLRIVIEKKPKSTKPVVTAASTRSSKTFTIKGVNFIMIPIEGSTFKMGATSEQSNPDYDEKPVHYVTLNSYYIGETEVTQALWEAVMGSNPSNFKGSSNPVENVSWDDCQEFINKLNSLTGQRFRLPTEAEWEYAARGGNKSSGYQYSGSNTLGDVAWYTDNSGNTIHPVKTKQPNELGIYDMSGNVEELCQDWHDFYSSSSLTNPTGPETGSGRVCRGGSWDFGVKSCRVASRDYGASKIRKNYLGLRLALSE